MRAWPTLVLIDPRGRIAGETSGEILADDFAQNIQEVIDQSAEVIDRTPLVLRPETQREPERPLRFPSKLLVAGGSLFISDTAHQRILQVRLDEDSLGGEIERVFGSGEAGFRDGAAGEAAFNYPHGLGLNGDAQTGTLYVADTENHALRAIDLDSGMVRTIAGTGQKAHGRLALGSPTETPLRSPWAVLPVSHYLFIALAGSHQIWVLISGEQLGPFAGDGHENLQDGPIAEFSFNQPSDLAFGMGYLFVADPEASAIRAISLDEAPQTVTLIGQGLFDFGDQDGPSPTALLQHPQGLAFADHKIYVADTYNNKIKLLDPIAGEIHTLIGSGLPGHQDGAFETAQLFEPEGVQVQGSIMYIADTNNHCIRTADLDTRLVHTFQLRGIEQLVVNRVSAAAGETLAPLQVAAGKVRLVLDVHLPDGYKRNPEVRTILKVGEGNLSDTLSFAAEQEIAWTINLTTDQEQHLELTLYYCQSKDAQLCLIHDRRLVLPLTVTPDGSAKARIPYKIQLP